MREKQVPQVANGTPTQRRLRTWLPGLLIAFLIVVVGGAPSLDAAFHPWIRLVGALIGVMYALSAIGIGTALSRMVRRTGQAESGWGLGLAAALGFSILLAVSHAMGVLGLLSVDRWWIALLVLAPGVVLFALHVAKGSKRTVDHGRPWASDWLFAGALGASRIVLCMAALVSPGWLWPSEFGAFDSLSYHLQLPKEWLATGRLWPVTNNVYAILPGTMEAAYMHVMSACGVIGGVPGSLSRFEGATMEAGGVAAQAVHAICAIAAALSVGELASAMARRVGVSESRQDQAGLAAQVLFLATPWVIVVGSISYNEMPMLLMFAGGLLVAACDTVRPWLRGLIVGWLVGSACMVKPTALLFVGVPCGIALLAWIPRRGWASAIVCGAAAGLLALIPYLVRNWMASGNPVFPYLHDVFGNGHWTAEQFTRFAGGHHFTGSWLDRLGLMVLPDMNDPAGARHRGLLHPQYAWLFPLTAIAIAGLVARKDLRRALWVLPVILLVQLVLWLAATHIQARFLLPLMVPACVAVGVVTCGAVWKRERVERVGAVVIAAAAVWGAVYSIIHMREALPASPSSVMANGGDSFHGLSLRSIDWTKETRDDRVKALRDLGPTAFVNQLWGEGALGSGKVYLLGDSTPFYFAAPVLYHTTWDTSPIGAAIRDFPAQPRWWTRGLRDRGVTSVLINFSEVERLRRSGWYDPAVTPEVLLPWVETLAPVRVWENLGVGLYLLPEPATDAT